MHRGACREGGMNAAARPPPSSCTALPPMSRSSASVFADRDQPQGKLRRSFRPGARRGTIRIRGRVDEVLDRMRRYETTPPDLQTGQSPVSQETVNRVIGDLTSSSIASRIVYSSGLFMVFPVELNAQHPIVGLE